MNNNTDIVFVSPAMKPKMKEESVGTLILSKKLLMHGFTVDIVRYWDISTSPKVDYDRFSTDIISKILSKNPTLVSFYCRCEEYHICLDLARRIKAINNAILISFGGPQAELVAEETIRRFDCVDYVCCSEGENTIVPFLQFIKSGCAFSEILSIEGLVYRDSVGKVCRNKLPQLLEDNFVRNYNYYDLIPQIIIDNTDCVQIDVGRGCPFACTFCSTKTFWKRKFRLRQIQNTLDEIEFVVNKFGVRRFDFQHDLFTASKKRVFEFCDGIEKRKLKIKWDCDSRIDTIDEEMIDRMIECGLEQIFFGIETGSSRMQKVINKNLKMDRCDSIVKYCIDKGLKVTTSFIYGFPEEIESDVDETLRMVVRFQNYGCVVLTNMCHIMNGTELYNRFKDDLYLSNTTSFNFCIPAFSQLYDLIQQNKEIFANFCDYDNPLRDEMKFIDVYRYTLQYAKNNCPQEHAFLAGKDYASLNMYRAFCRANENVFRTTVHQSDGDPSGVIKTLKKHTAPETYELMIRNLIAQLL